MNNGLKEKAFEISPCNKACKARWLPQPGQSYLVTNLKGHFRKKELDWGL